MPAVERSSWHNVPPDKATAGFRDRWPSPSPGISHDCQPALGSPFGVQNGIPISHTPVASPLAIAC